MSSSSSIERIDSPPPGVVADVAIWRGTAWVLAVDAGDRRGDHGGIDPVDGLVVVDGRVVVLEAERFEAGSAHAAVERAGDGEHRVANCLGLQAPAVHPPEE